MFLKKAHAKKKSKKQTPIFRGQMIAKEKKQSQFIFPFCNSVCE